MSPKVVGVLPARLDSKRFYGKVIYNYRGKPLLYYLYSEFSKSKVIDRLIIATDHKKVKNVAESFGAEVMMTGKNLKCGTERTAEIANHVKADIYLNIQADVFGLKHTTLDRTIKEFKKDLKAEYGTLARRIEEDAELVSPDSVKVIINEKDNAGWFSRYPIPYLRHSLKKPRSEQHDYYYHIGVYLFKRGALKQFANWKRSENEKAESLEQLRILDNDKNIKVYLTRAKTVSVDSPQDLKKLKEVYK
jgi:3-deoxy-manno-octulosonate cytidylyltransferase (CMP-KDO synthetase)